METIFDFNPTDEEIEEITGSVMNKEYYIQNHIPKIINSIGDEVLGRPNITVGFLAMFDICVLFDKNIRNEKEKEVEYFKKINILFPNAMNSYFNE